MNAKDFLDIIHELIMVETDYGLIYEAFIKDGSLIVKLREGPTFNISIEELRNDSE